MNNDSPHIFNAECDFKIMERYLISQITQVTTWILHLETIHLSKANPYYEPLPQKTWFILSVLFFCVGVPWRALCPGTSGNSEVDQVRISIATAPSHKAQGTLKYVRQSMPSYVHPWKWHDFEYHLWCL